MQYYEILNHALEAAYERYRKEALEFF